MRILVTGGLGYIGGVLVDSIITQDTHVRILDSQLYGNQGWESNAMKEVVIGDVNDEAVLRKAIDGVDSVVHLAAIVGDQACDLDKERSIRTNYLATRKLAHLCAESRIPLVFFSTCSVYGAKSGSLITETDNVLPLSIYAISKLAGEEAVAKSGADHTILRLGTVYGPSRRMRFDLVVNRMVAQSIRDRKISIFGGGQQRPFVHVQDVAANCLKALKTGVQGLFNLGGTNWKILDLGEMISRITGCELEVFEEIKDPRDYAVDSSLAAAKWGAQFDHNIEGTISQIEDYIRGARVTRHEDPIYNNADWLRRSLN